MNQTVPLFKFEELSAAERAELHEKIIEVVDGGRYILGPEVEQFEAEFATHLGVEHAIGVANGTDALTIALQALGVGPGDEVIVPSFTFYASAEAIVPTGALPVFCDIDPNTYCVTKATVEAALTPKSKAVIAVDLFGNVAPIDEIKELGLPVIEDAAQAAGSRYQGKAAGSLGDLATFSFFPSKNLGCFGDGGAVVTDSEELAEQVKMLRFHGSRDKSSFELVGYNSRLDELQAAILRLQLARLDGWTAGRRQVAERYDSSQLSSFVKLPLATDGCEPAWHLYVVQSVQAEGLSTELQSRGVASKGYYRTPIHQQPAMQQYAANVQLPATELVAKQHLALPFGPALTSSDTEYVVSCVTELASE